MDNQGVCRGEAAHGSIELRIPKSPLSTLASYGGDQRQPASLRFWWSAIGRMAHSASGHWGAVQQRPGRRSDGEHLNRDLFGFVIISRLDCFDRRSLHALYWHGMSY
jgi:hypothetical protein